MTDYWISSLPAPKRGNCLSCTEKGMYKKEEEEEETTYSTPAKSRTKFQNEQKKEET